MITLEDSRARSCTPYIWPNSQKLAAPSRARSTSRGGPAVRSGLCGAFSGGCAAHGLAVLAAPPAKSSPALWALLFRIACHDRRYPGPQGRKSLAGGVASRAKSRDAKPPVTGHLSEQRQCRDWPRGFIPTADGVMFWERSGTQIPRLRRVIRSPCRLVPPSRARSTSRAGPAVRSPLWDVFSGGCAAHGSAVLAAPPAKSLPALRA